MLIENELQISYITFLKWLENQLDTKIIGITHSSSHSFFSRYLQELTNIKAVYVFTTTTKFCKLGIWKEFSNPEWMVKLIFETNQLHKIEKCNKWNQASLGKHLTKADVLACIAKLKR